MFRNFSLIQQIGRLNFKSNLFSFALLSIFFICSISVNAQKQTEKRGKQLPLAQPVFDSIVKMNEIRVEKYSNAVKLTWETYHETNILNYNVWKDVNGKKILLNDSLIGGSLLKSASGVLTSGFQYNYNDPAGDFSSTYWLEAIDINGKSEWFGPYGVEFDLISSTENLDLQTPKDQTGKIGQINRVDFAPKKSVNVSKIQPEDLSSFTNDAGALKFDIKTDGWYKIDAQSLHQFGFQENFSANWKLFADGIEQPMTINPDGSIEFYGRGADTFYTDAKVYWLNTTTGIGKRINFVNQNYLDSAQDSWTRMIAEKKDKIIRAPGILNGARENWYGSVVASSNNTQTLNLSEIATESGETATVSVDIQGSSTVPHQVTVTLNGNLIGTIAFNYRDRREWNLNVPLSQLVEGANTIVLKSPSSSDISFLEAVRINYPRRLKAENNRLNFNVGAGNTVRLKGFTTQQVRLFDITDPTNINEIVTTSRLEINGTYSVTIAPSASPRVFIAQGESVAMLSATPLVSNYASDLRNTANGAKFIIIAPRNVLPKFNQLKAMRTNEGLPTEVIDITDIYDEFSNGNKSADAIKSFLRYAYENWTIKPQYVMIAGDSSVDPRNYSGLGGATKDMIPTTFVDTWDSEALSDEMLVDFNGDSLGEIQIGRLPYNKESELDAILRKILAAEPLPLWEIKQRGVSFVSDAYVGYDFEAASRRIATYVPTEIVPNYIDRGSLNPTVVQNRIIEKINSGAAIVSYFGHGHITNWTGSNILRSTDSTRMFNNARPTFMVMVACLNGAFAETSSEGLAEAVIKTPTGGAYAVWSSSASNGADIQEFLAKEFYGYIFSGMRMGDAIRQTKAIYYAPDIRRTYVFFGDPTQRVVLVD